MTRKKKRQKKLLKTSAKLTNKLIGLIDSSKIIEIKTMQFVLACEILNEKEKEKMSEVITMKDIEKEEIFQGYLTKEERQECIKKGIEKGIEKEKEEIAKNLIKLGQKPELIAKATKMSKTQIATLTTTML